jgi:hypothetical protein
MQQFTIDGETYVINALPVRRATPVFTRLVKVLGPALAELVAAKKPGADVALAVGRSIAYAAEKLAPEDLDFVIDTFADFGQVGGKDLGKKVGNSKLYDLHFAGKFGALAKWLEECVSFNFSDFLAFALSAQNSGQDSEQQTPGA